MGTLPPEINRQEALKDLLEVQAVFDSFGVPIFVTYGALLGIVRDGDFIEYDDDIDLCVTLNIDYKTRKMIGHRFLDLGFEKQSIAFNVFGYFEDAEAGYNGDGETGIIVMQKRIRTTVFFFKEEDCATHGKELVCIPKQGSYPLISTPARFFQKPEYVTLKGHRFLCPSPKKEYLEFTYGDWKKRIKGKHALQYQEMHGKNLLG